MKTTDTMWGNAILQLYLYEEYGFSCISIQEKYYARLLEYEIESKCVD